MTGNNLKQKAASGMLWTSIQKFSGMGITFISGIILARLLTPEDYGCIGMLSIFMVIAGAFVDGGFASALIQKKRPTQEDYSTIFFFNLGMSLIMYSILFLCAPAIARFYKMPLLSSVLRVQGLVLIISAFSIIQRNQLRKQFRFKKLTIVHLVSSIISVTITVIMAYHGFGVWSLVANNLITAFLPTVVYWLTNKWYPLLVFSKKSFKDLFGFGFYMFLAHLVDTVCNNIQGLLIGRLYNPTTMGYYSKAKSTEEMASTSLSSVMGQVTYPLYAEYQYDKARLSIVIKRITNTVAYITVPLMLLLILLAKPLFVLLYSDKWLSSVPYFQILCIAGIAICFQSINYQAIAAIGKSKIMLRWTFIKRGIGLCLIIGGLLLWGINGLLAGMVAQSWIIYLINAYLVDKYVGFKLLKQLKELVPIMSLATIALVVAYLFGFFLSSFNLYVCAIIELFAFGVIYYGGSVLFNLESYRYFKENLPLILNKNKKKQ